MPIKTIRATQTLVVLAALVFVSCSNRRLEKLTNDIGQILASQKGEFAVAFKDLSNSNTVSINSDQMFHAASTMKTPVMIEVYKQAAQGKFALTDSVLIKTEFNSLVDSTFKLSPTDDSELTLYDLAGAKRPISELVYKMITASSNLATNIIVDLVGASNVTQTMRDLGAAKIEVLRGVEDNRAYRAGLNNRTSAGDLLTIFEKMAKGEAVSPEASAAMIAILSSQEFNTIIPAKLPKDVRVAHKTGWLTGLNHDSGIVFLPDGRKYVLVILSNKLEDEKKAIDAMADVSKLIYDFMNEQ